MGRTWFVGDIHGCAAEWRALLERMQPAAGDRVIALGDLFHRGPDPLGVWRLAEEVPGFESLCGNHEHAMLRRLGTGPAEDLRGDGGAAMAPLPAGAAARLVQAARGLPYHLAGEGAEGPWIAVHAGFLPGTPLERTRPAALVRLRGLRDRPGHPLWFEVHAGPELVVFGHKPFREPFQRRAGGRLVALGLDTGCVYGGRLTAWCLEERRFESVPAGRDHRI